MKQTGAVYINSRGELAAYRNDADANSRVIRNPPDGPYNAHHQGGVWRIFKGDELAVGCAPHRKLESALLIVDALNAAENK